MIRRKPKRRKNPLPPSFSRIPNYTFEEDIQEYKKIQEGYIKMLEYLELCETDEDFQKLMKDRKTRNDIYYAFELISGGAEDVKLAITDTMNNMLKLADWVANKYGLEI